MGSYASLLLFYSHIKVVNRELESPDWLHLAPIPNFTPVGLIAISLEHTLQLSPALLPSVTIMHTPQLLYLLIE